MLTAEQAIARRSGIGSSDVPALWDMYFPATERLDAYRDARDVYFEKTGDPLSEIRAESDAMMEGNFFEEAILSIAEKYLGLKLERHTQRVLPDEYMVASFDGIDWDAKAIVEAKFVQDPRVLKKFGRAGSDQVPNKFFLQQQHQLYVAGKDFKVSHLAALRCPSCPELVRLSKQGQLDFDLHGSGFGKWVVKRDDEICSHIARMCGTFWRDHILAKNPPEIRKEAA